MLLIQTYNFFRVPNVPWIINLPGCCVPRGMLRSCYFLELFNWFEYTDEKAFQQCEENNGKIYEGVVVCVAKEDRRQGLGKL